MEIIAYLKGRFPRTNENQSVIEIGDLNKKMLKHIIKGVTFIELTVVATVPLQMGDGEYKVKGRKKTMLFIMRGMNFIQKKKAVRLNNQMKFEGNSFKHAEPTIDSSGRGVKATAEFVGNASNYRKFKEY